MSTLLNGDLAQIIVAKQALKTGYEVSVPMAGHSHYDLVLRDKKGKFIAVQVKKAFWVKSRNNYYVEIARNSFNRRSRTQRLKYTPEQVDYLIACDVETEDVWIFPLELVNKHSSNMSLGTRQALDYKNRWPVGQAG